MPVEGVNGYLDIENTGLRVSQVGIANTTPEHLLSVGSNLFVSGDSSDVLTVTGNVVCQGVKIDFMEITPSYDLAAVSNVGNVTSNAIQFTNPDTGIVATGNVTVGNTLTISGFRVTAQTPVTDDLESITKSTLVKPNSGITPHAIHITNATDSTSAYTGALQVGSIGGGQEGGLGVAGNVHVARDVHVGGGIYTASNLEVGTSNLFVNTTTSNVGIGTNTPTASLHVIGDTIVSSNLKVGGSKLFVDTTNSSVGIGTNTPSANLHVIGDALISSNLDVVGNALISSNLDVAGDINLSGTFNQNGALFKGSEWTRTGDNISYRTGRVTIGPIHRFVVTVQQVSGVNKYFINGVDRPTLQLYQGETYIFDLSDSSLITPSVHPFIFSTSANGSAYTTGITTTGAYGSTEERTFTPVVSVATPTTLYYYCTVHPGMGATASISPAVDLMFMGNVAISENLTVIPGTVTTGTVTTGNVTITENLTVTTGNVSVDTDTLFVDSVNDRVGVGTTTPGTTLDVVGTIRATGNVSVDTDTLFVDSVNDRVGVGTTTPGYTLDVVGTIRATTDVVVTSDRRLKSDIKRIEGALEKISKINGYMYTHNNQASSGCMAQEVKEVLPEVVRGSEDTMYALAYGNMAGLIIEAIKELKSEMDELKSSHGII